MGYDIKKLKPRKNSHYHQGYIAKDQCTKCINESGDPVIYRSGLEYQFINYCENNPKIIKWASEPIEIKYTSRFDNKEHSYFPDYVIENSKGEKIIIEIKPWQQTQKPKKDESLWLKETWLKNMDKWVHAKKYALDRGMKFLIITEKFFE